MLQLLSPWAVLSAFLLGFWDEDEFLGKPQRLQNKGRKHHTYISMLLFFLVIVENNSHKDQPDPAISETEAPELIQQLFEVEKLFWRQKYQAMAKQLHCVDIPMK